jgi:hypothetical protein
MLPPKAMSKITSMAELRTMLKQGAHITHRGRKVTLSKPAFENDPGMPTRWNVEGDIGFHIKEDQLDELKVETKPPEAIAAKSAGTSTATSTIKFPFFGRLHADDSNKLLVTNCIDGPVDNLDQILISIEVGRVKNHAHLLPLLGEIVSCKPTRHRTGWIVERYPKENS